MKGAGARLPWLLLSLACARVAAGRDALDFATLMHGGYAAPIDLAAFGAPDAAPPAAQRRTASRFEGVLELRFDGTLPHRVLLADPAYVSEGDVAVASTWPAGFAYEFVQSGDQLVPVRRGAIPGSHDWWELVLEPGRVWDEPGDHGYTRAAIPFSLQEKNANCVHNGVLMFLFRRDGRTSHTAMQVSSETCHYLQLDLWGLLDTHYVPRAVAGRGALLAAHRAAQAARMPTATLAQLQARHPSLDLAALAIGEPAGRTLYGVVVDGVDYVAPCATRHGDHPYCAQLDLPSYSLAKSVVAALALMRLQQLDPRSATQTVASLVPECDLPAWQGVTLANALDMATGNYDSPGYEADEDAPKVDGLFLPPDHAHKIGFACGAYPRRSPPGTTWAYHSSDTYVLGTAMASLLRRRPEWHRRDFFDDLVVADLYAPLGLSPTSRVTRRTYDAIAQPFTGWGLVFQSDDIAKLGVFLARDAGAIAGRQVIDAGMLAAALQRNPGDRGLPVAGRADLRYQHGFWARNLRREPDCGTDTWIPFMSGYGGISVVLLPGGIVYWNFADDGRAASFDWERPARALAAVGGYCRPATAPSPGS